ncbi:ABC transporter permease [Bordetella genomosp. 5]|uniref:Sulfonate ABC transporter permease n=1 Tax=Bordetella genomosp. 5 TaxID=1395608 RepID=A0A261T4H0_9BORD|nr:ABC transporter permease subunit [Bordetella genomosp. 5]OZI44157.1 sulfonate ABC transporter permease [Bordetella genomosp. 5]
MVDLARVAYNARAAALPRARLSPSWADALAFLLLAALMALAGYGLAHMRMPLAALQAEPVVLDPARLPFYALLTTLRMFAALAVSLLFTFVVGTLAARSRRAARVIVPALDVLQSVPVLGFLSFTVTFFMGWFPGNQLGVECAAVFAIFTSQAWNMTFGFYQSLRTVPADLAAVATQFGFSRRQRFLRLELPFAVPGLVWNTMMSMSGGWFFVVASEAITVGDTTVALPGLGSWLAQAIAHENMLAVAQAVGAMAVVILLYDQLVFRPVVVWADKFRVELTASSARPRSWMYTLIQRTRWLRLPFAMLARAACWLAETPLRWPVPVRGSRRAPVEPWRTLMRVAAVRASSPAPARGASAARGTRGGVAMAAAAALVTLYLLWRTPLDVAQVGHVLGLGALTLLRVTVLLVLASVIWVPIGVWIGLRPAWAGRVQPLAQFLAAFPANVLFPFAVMAIVGGGLDPEIWLSPLMILGTQWYILFNVIAGASAIPADLKDAARMLGLRGWQRWRRLLLPAILPFYVTGALTAAGGSWNASIVAESIQWGERHLTATGLGAWIAHATEAGQPAAVALGVIVMSVYVLAFTHLLWRPLYRLAERRCRLDG